MSYDYFAFGLNISSEIQCPQLFAGDRAPADVTVRYGSTRYQLERVLAQGQTYTITADCLLLDIEATARYLVRVGTEILVEPHADAPENDVRLFLLGSSFGALLLQRGYWPLHGSAIKMRRGAVIFVGPSGNGKSTLAAVFNQRGFPALTDDISAITVDPDGVARLWPAYPCLNLRPDAFSHLRLDPGSSNQAHKAGEKFELPLDTFNPAPVPVYAIYILSIQEQPGIRLAVLKGFDKINALTENTYRLHFLKGMQRERLHFQQAQALARQARVVQASRPPRQNTLEELADHIERDLSL